MKTTDNTAGCSFLCIILFSTLGIAQEVDKAMLWPSDALSKVMRSDTPQANSEHLLRIFGARDEILSSQAVFRPASDISAAAASITGKPVGNVRPGGSFLQAHFMSAGDSTIEVSVEHNGRKRTTERTLNLRYPDDKITTR